MARQVYSDYDEEAEEILAADQNPAPDAPFPRDADYDREWNIRKCSAATLDAFGMFLGGDLLPTLLPLLEARLKVSSVQQ